MKITKENILITDIETIKSFFLICAYNPAEDKWYVFSINQYRNELLYFIKFLDIHRDFYWVTFNGLSFDFQVVEYIWRNYEKWHDLSSLEICHLIWEFSQKVIDDTNYGLFPPYHENTLTFKQLDVFRIQHFDNKMRRVSLKRLEYEMDMEDIEDMGVPHDKASFTEEEDAHLIYYCKNDVLATWKNMLYLLGEVENPLYAGNNQIEIREALSEEFGFNCLNYSNSKYGDEIIKSLYCKETRLRYDELPKKGTFRKEVFFKKGIPEFVEFSTDELSQFLRRIRTKKLKATEDFKEDVEFRGQTYTFALGGLHNKIANKVYESDEETAIIDVDVTSYYPATILDNGYAPAHLNRAAFLRSYRWIYDQRVHLKPKAKKDNRIKGIVAGYKEALNAAYGKMGDITNWMYDPQSRLNVCIAGELAILMLIEQQELAGNSCIMANTDGATFLVKRAEIDNFNDVCALWKQKTNYELEFFQFKKLCFLSVNGYIGEYENGELKFKNTFLLWTELHKKKTFRVIPLALKAHLIDRENVEEFIGNHNNIYDFCSRNSAGKSYYNAAFDEDGVEEPLFRVIRYYVAKKGQKLRKMVKEGNDTGARSANIQPADKPKTICNHLQKHTHTAHLENVDKNWYIDEANKILFRLKTGKKPKNIQTNPNQISMF